MAKIKLFVLCVFLILLSTSCYGDMVSKPIPPSEETLEKFREIKGKEVSPEIFQMLLSDEGVYFSKNPMCYTYPKEIKKKIENGNIKIFKVEEIARNHQEIVYRVDFIATGTETGFFVMSNLDNQYPICVSMDIGTIRNN